MRAINITSAVLFVVLGLLVAGCGGEDEVAIEQQQSAVIPPGVCLHPPCVTPPDICEGAGGGRCGNGCIDPGEQCDGAALGGNKPLSTSCKPAGAGFTGGTLKCKSDCTYDTSACTSTCGDGIKSPAEACDGTELGGATCVSLGFVGGTLKCNACQLDTSGCTLCGNGVKNGVEQCDGTDLGGASCHSLGYDVGLLACRADCTFDRAACKRVATFTQLSAGNYACGLRTDGGIQCWDQPPIGPGWSSSPPSLSGGPFQQISTGGDYVCAVTAGYTNEVRCSSRGLPPTSPLPKVMVKEVTLGSKHSCALTTSGTVQCWGDNYYGQSSPLVGTYSLVTAGYDHTCGLETDGTVQCWGDNYQGASTPPAGTFTQLGAGNDHTCGIKTDGTLQCWGFSYMGAAAPPAGTFTSVSAGSGHTCGLRSDGQVLCWGDNTLAQATPPNVANGTITQLSAGDDYTCGLRTDGRVLCWGGGYRDLKSGRSWSLVALYL